MITLTTPVPQPNVTRVRAISVVLNDAGSFGYVTLQLLSPPAGGRSLERVVQITNGPCDRLIVNATPKAWDDTVTVDQTQVIVANGFDQLEAAYNGASRAARFRAVETALISMGVISSALSGAVS